MRIRKRQLLWLNLFVIAMMASAQAQRIPEQVAQQDIPVEIIKIDTNLVVLRIAVSDQQGRAATNLRQEAFKVFEDGIEQQVSFFSAEESPVSWSLVLDRSGSMMDMMSDVYDAALHVIDGGTAHHETSIITFNKRPELVIDFSSDRHRLENSILGLRAVGETSLFDAVEFALDRLRSGKHRKKVVVVVTDGEDNASRLKFRELIGRAEEEEAVIYTVGMFGSMGNRLGVMGMARYDRNARAELKKLAEVTGGSSHFPNNVDECKSVMKEIAREVGQQYSLGYYPLNKERNGNWRSIKVPVTRTGNSGQLIARTRTGYYARKPQQPN